VQLMQLVESKKVRFQQHKNHTPRFISSFHQQNSRNVFKVGSWASL